MTKDIILLDLFSGIGGFTKGLEQSEEFGCSPHRRELAEQFIREFTDTLQGLSYSGSQEEKNLFGLQTDLLLERILYETLSKMEEIWESENVQTKSTHEYSNIRRLTMIEAERLQGFDKSWLDGSEPANWTKYGLYPTKRITQEQFNKLPNEEKIAIFNKTFKKEIPKTQRYKQCGNAVMVDCVKAIGIKLFKNYVIENNDTETRG